MISVIIPVFNVERYIKWCLMSFENQLYTDFELILVNDGSTDNSYQIIREYIKSSKLRINLLNQQNSGVSAARNNGIRNAQGKYICFVDSDDMVAPSYLKDMVETLESNNSDFVIVDYREVHENDSENTFDEVNLQVNQLDSISVFNKFLYRDIKPGVWCLMIKNEIISKNNLKFREGQRYSEDIEFIYKLISFSDKISLINKKLYLYRIRSTSVMSLVDEKRKDGYMLMKDLEDFFKYQKPTFYEEYLKFGVARWVWATVRQLALAHNNYESFIKSTLIYDTNINMRKLHSFPRLKVRMSAFLFSFQPKLYYYIFSSMKNSKVNRVYISQ